MKNFKIKSVLTTLFCLSILVISAQRIKLQEGTSIRIAIRQELNSKTAEVGDIVDLEVIDDIDVDGVIVVKGGTPVKGEITEASKAKILGAPGKIDFTVNFTRAVDGQNIRIRSNKKFSGKNSAGGVIAAAAIVNPLFLLIKGKNVSIKPGQNFNAYVDKDYTIWVGL